MNTIISHLPFTSSRSYSQIYDLDSLSLSTSSSSSPTTTLTRKRLKLLLLLLWSSFSLLYLISLFRPTPPPTSPAPVRIHYHSDENSSPPLLSPTDCPITVIYTTDEKAADVVVYNSDRGHAGLLNDGDRLRVREERPWQMLAVSGAEAGPNRVGLERHYKKMHEGRANDTFDYDLTYRLNSTAPTVYAYSYFNFPNPPVPYPLKRQNKLLNAFITNCSPKNGRTLILKELMSLLGEEMDSFGSCENNADPEQVLRELGRWEQVGEEGSRWNIKITMISLYKFTIAMENCNEPDYVTEKYFQAMETGTVPLHFGSPTFSSFLASPHSGIDIASYLPRNSSLLTLSTTSSTPPPSLTPAEKAGLSLLATRLKYLGSEPGREEYEKMLEWKKKPQKEWGGFGEVVRLGRLGWSQDCRLAGVVRGQGWARTGWKEGGRGMWEGAGRELE